MKLLSLLRGEKPRFMMSDTESFLRAWESVYFSRTGIKYRRTPGEAEFLIKSDCLGLLKSLDYKSFCAKSIDYLASRRMKVTIQNSLDRFNEIALHQFDRAPAHQPFDAEAYRKELEEISGKPIEGGE